MCQNGWRMGMVCHTLCLLTLLHSESIIAQGWDITPRLTIAEIYTDNRDLDPPGDEESDAVTELNPGISVRRQSARLDLSLDYSMQNLFRARDGEFETNHRLAGRSTTELIKEHLFFDADASVRQVLISAEDRSLDTLAGDDDRTTVVTYGLGPRWRSDFAGYATAQARYRFNGVLVGEGASDAFIHTANAGLDSGRQFTALNWGLNYSYQLVDRRDGEDTTRQSADANVSYRLTDAWTLLARGGYEKHDLATLTTAEDGTFWSLGASWTPSRFIAATVLYGPDDKEYSLRLSPTRRTSLFVSRRERDVGVDPGVDWSGTLTHRTRYSTWSASYSEEVTSVQEVLLTEDPFLIIVDEQGNETIFDEQGRVISRQDLFTLRDAEFVRKRFQTRVGYGRGKSQFRVGAFFEEREFETAVDDETAFGGNAGWTWRFTPRTRLLVDGSWDRTEFEDDRQDDLWLFQVGLARTFTRDVNASLDYRYAQRESNEPDQDFRENRITVRLTMVF